MWRLDPHLPSHIRTDPPELCLSKPFTSISWSGVAHKALICTARRNSYLVGFCWPVTKTQSGKPPPDKDFCPNQDPEDNEYKWWRVTAAAQMCLERHFCVMKSNRSKSVKCDGEKDCEAESAGRSRSGPTHRSKLTVTAASELWGKRLLWSSNRINTSVH